MADTHNHRGFSWMSKSILLPLFCGFIGAALALWGYHTWQELPQTRIANTYEDEMVTFVSPTTVKKYIDQKNKNYILVDLRSKQEYDTEHITTAINIPAVSLNTDQLVASFKRLPTNKEIIVHCYSASCTLGRQVGQTLAEHGIYVKEMDVGWNEWRYHWDLWNPGAGPLDGKVYIVAGAADPNAPIIPCTVGMFGC